MKLRHVALIARFELLEAVRSRKALALAVLFVASALAGTALFVEAVEAMEHALSDTLAVARTAKVGTMTSALFQSEQFHSLLARLVGDSELANELVTLPPLALFYGAFSLGCVPLLIVLSASDSIAQDVQTGAVRYSLFRTDKLSYVLGKFAGQAGLLALGLLAGALASYTLGWFTFAAFDPLPTAGWMLALSARTWLYGLAFLGVALCVSQLTTSANAARAFGILAWLLLSVGHRLLERPRVLEHSPVLAPSVQLLFPQAHRLELWRQDFQLRAASEVMLIALAGVFVALGYLRFRGRDG
jgi:ABC-type transport system involved in multi-copper enzyme maturation permease subunit